MTKKILEVKDLKTQFDVTKGFLAKKQIVKAVDGVTFDVFEGDSITLSTYMIE